MELNIKKLKNLLREETEENFKLITDELDSANKTYTFEHDDIILKVSSNETSLTILNIQATFPGEGTGTIIYETLQDFCIDEGFTEIIARNVPESGNPLWIKYGFEKNGENYIKQLK
jgi:hypothetical protein